MLFNKVCDTVLFFSPDVAVIDDAQSNSFRNVIRMSLYWHE